MHFPIPLPCQDLGTVDSELNSVQIGRKIKSLSLLSVVEEVVNKKIYVAPFYAKKRERETASLTCYLLWLSPIELGKCHWRVPGSRHCAGFWKWFWLHCFSALFSSVSKYYSYTWLYMHWNPKICIELCFWVGDTNKYIPLKIIYTYIHTHIHFLS